MEVVRNVYAVVQILVIIFKHLTWRTEKGKPKPMRNGGFFAESFVMSPALNQKLSVGEGHVRLPLNNYKLHERTD